MNTHEALATRQTQTCRKYGATALHCDRGMKLGISNSVRDQMQPLHGLRVNPVADKCGWYIWAGDWSDDPDFFKPIHVEHLSALCPRVLPFLQLPPGWRFLLTEGHEDAWFDPELVL